MSASQIFAPESHTLGGLGCGRIYMLLPSAYCCLVACVRQNVVCSQPAVATPRLSVVPVCQFSSGLTFEDDGSRLVSIQKPLGVTLQEIDEDTPSGVVVTSVAAGSSSERAGVQIGDVLMAVNNLDVSSATFESVIGAISSVPGRVVNLRFRPLDQRGGG